MSFHPIIPFCCTLSDPQSVLACPRVRSANAFVRLPLSACARTALRGDARGRARELFSLRCRDAPQFYIFPYDKIDMQRNKAVRYTLCVIHERTRYTSHAATRVYVSVCACVCVAASTRAFLLSLRLGFVIVFRAGSRLALGAGEYIVCMHATRSAASLASTVHICTCTCRYAHAHAHAYAHAHARAHVHAHVHVSTSARKSPRAVQVRRG